MVAQSKASLGGRADDPGERPVLSIVIACYNGASTLPAQLESLASQPCPVSFEVLLCDNGSTDASRQVALAYAGRMTVRIVDAAAVRGPAYARNCGVEEAQGSLVAFCDADDEVAPDWLTTMVAALRTDSFVAGRVDVDKLNHGGAGGLRLRDSRVMHQQVGLQTSGIAGNLPHAGAGNMGVHRDVFRAVGGFDTSLRCLEDSDLCWRIQRAGTPLVYHPEVLIHTRLRDTVRGMARQGYAYGECFAVLEDRYADGPVSGPPTGHDVPPLARLRGHLGVCRERGLGGTVWHLAWHLGHRRARSLRRRESATRGTRAAA